MTGLHNGHTYVRGNQEVRPMGQVPLPAGTITVARFLQEAGYSTGLIGKWGLGGPDSVGHPNQQGFDYFFGYLCQRHAHNYYPEFLFRNGDRVPLEGNRIADPRPDGAGQAIEKVTYSPDLMIREAVSFIESNQEKPFFLYFASTLPHANNEAGDEGMEIPSYGRYENEDWPEPQKGHAAMISRLDKDVGILLETLHELDLESNTLVIFTSDNGPHREGGADPEFFQSSGPLKGIKRDLYEGGIRVPMIAYWPGKIRPGSESSHISAFWDFLPTVLDTAGVKVPELTDGISYLPALLGKHQPEHEYLYWEFKEMQAVRMGKWKGIRKGPEEAIEIYDLDSDMGETQNIAQDYPEIAKRIEEILREAHTPSELFPMEIDQ